MSKRSFLFIIVTVFVILFWILRIWGSVQLGPFLHIPLPMVWLDRHGQQIKHPSAGQLVYTGYEAVPSTLVDVIVRLEDQRFWYHPGIDPLSLAATLRMRRQWWASTIDQQLIKLRDERFAQRNRQVKIRENILALVLQTKLSKKEILTDYLNQTHFPRSVRGYRQACLSFFASECNNLSVGHLVTLYARAKYPHRRDLSEYILAILQHLGHTEYTSEDVAAIMASMQRPQSDDGQRAYWEIIEKVQKVSEGKRQKNIVETSFDPELQQFVGQSIEKFMPYLTKYEAQDACVIIMDGADVIAADIARSQFAPDATINTCLIPRQIWSVGKPLLYSLALHDLGRTPETILHDETTMYSWWDGYYIPRNSTLQTHGEVSLADALGSSLNIPAVETLAQVGVASYWSFLRRLGTILETSTTRYESPDDYGLSLALGTKAITPVDLTQMRSVFAQCHSGTSERLNSWCLQYGKVLDTIAHVLMVNSYRRYTFPINNRLDMPGVYAKTWTSRKFVDGRVCGGDGRYTVCVRVGNASGAPMKDSGYTTAGMLWHAMMERVQ